MKIFFGINKIPLFFAVFVFFYGLHFVQNIHLGAPPDEVPHLSYINDAMKSAYAMPDYKAGKMINSEELNYLAHPPLYYSISAAIGFILNLEPYEDYHAFRIMSLSMVAIGLLLVMMAAVNLRVKNYQIFLMGAMAVSVPNFFYIGSSINNDNLSFLGASILFYSLTIFHTEKRYLYDRAVLGVVASLFVLAMTKANVALFSGVLFIVWMCLGKFNTLKLFVSRQSLAAIIFFGVLVLAYYLYTWFVFDKFLPSPKYVYKINPVAEPMGIIEYLKNFSVLLLSRFAVAYGHSSYDVYSGVFLKLFYIITILPILFYFSIRIFSKKLKSSAYPLFDALFFASITLLIVHVVLGYQGYLQTGLIAAVQPRYYLFLIPVIWMPAFYILSKFYDGKLWVPILLAPVLILFSNTLSSAPRQQILSNDKTAKATLVTLNKVSVDKYYQLNLPMMNHQAGFIDFIGHRETFFAVQGWSFDVNQSKTPIYIHVFLSGKPLLRGEITHTRPDVALSLVNSQASLSGFNIKLINPAFRFAICSIDVIAEFDGGIYSNLHRATCN
jgi:hypothetical protein